MPRRYRPAKRKLTPDPKFNNLHIEMFVNRLMRDGKKSTARQVMYEAFEIIEQRTKQNPVEVFEQALANAKPVIEVKARRVGGSTYQVPMEVSPYRQNSLAMRWLLSYAAARGGKGMAEKLAGEFIDAANNQGNTIKKKEDVHRMAEANRTFAHYRW